MPMYKVYVKVTDYFLVEVEAEDEYEAAELGEMNWVDLEPYDSDVIDGDTELA